MLSARHCLIVIKNSTSNLWISVFIPLHTACYVIRHGRNDKSRKGTHTFTQIVDLLQLHTLPVNYCGLELRKLSDVLVCIRIWNLSLWGPVITKHTASYNIKNSAIFLTQYWRVPYDYRNNQPLFRYQDSTNVLLMTLYSALWGRNWILLYNVD